MSYTHVQYYWFFSYHVVRTYQTLHLSYHNYIIPETSHFTQYSINSTYTVFHVQEMLYNNLVLCLTYSFILTLYAVCLYDVYSISIMVLIVVLLSDIYHIFYICVNCYL